MSDELQALRDQIDGIDDEIVRLLHARAEVLHRLFMVKRAEDAPFANPERERAVLDHVTRARGAFPPAAMRALYRELLRLSAVVAESSEEPSADAVALRWLCSPTISVMKPYVPGKPVEVLERELGIKDAVKLASNENPLGASPRALAAVREMLHTTHSYPEGSSYFLRQALAAKHGVEMDQIICGSGAYELLELCVRTFCVPEEEIIHARPSFVAYDLAAQEHGVGEVVVPLDDTNDFRYDVDAMLARVTPRTKVLFLANPNNPTGAYLGRTDFERLVFDLPPSVILAVDEAYFEYTHAGDFPDSTRYHNARERILTFRTFSKVQGLAGLRVGYCIGSPTMIGFMQRVRPPFNVTSVAQAAALAAIDDHEHVARSRQLNLQGLAYLHRELKRLGVKTYPSQANFVFVDLGRPSAPVYEALLRKGVIVRPIGGPQHLRVSVGLPEENERFVRALAEVLA
ncbi:MAG: histidinol-phosphate transaminase [Deltaproteobacteria bacterium]|nr:histidinol-phosphate transaminase [Deltaproteobacteria bacterium]